MIALSPEVKAKMIERVDPHCVVWVNATASLWGMSHDHHLDEPVRLSEEAPVRLRYVGDQIISDRKLTMKTLRPGHHAALRFVFRNGYFFEVDVPGIHEVTRADRTAEISLCS